MLKCMVKTQCENGFIFKNKKTGESLCVIWDHLSSLYLNGYKMCIYIIIRSFTFISMF